MLSINQLNLAVDNIETIFISHLHGDHTFGLPFIIISKWIENYQAGTISPVKIIGPSGIEQYVKKITEYAFTTSNPCYEWLELNVEFCAIKNHASMPLENMRLLWFNLEHVVETYGFIVETNDEAIFAYIADTKWCPQVEQILARRPKIVFADMNGGDPNIHMSLNEVAERGLPITKSDTIYYGTHLSDEFEHSHRLIKCAKQGDKIRILH